ncbi:MAG: sigma 54-interacting transcriptional regulator [Clostridiaceae bacterium]
MTQIAFIAPNKQIEEVAKKAKSKYQLDIDIFLGLMEEGVRVAEQLRIKGYKVFISRGGTALLLREKLSLEVIEIKMTLDDAISSIIKAKSYGDRIQLVGFSNHLQGFDSLGPSMGLDIRQDVVAKKEDIDCVIQKAKDEGVDVIIGGAMQLEAAEKIGIPSVFLGTSEEGVYKAFCEAEAMVNVIRNYERRENEIYTILDFSGQGFIAIDLSENITLVNQFAANIFGCDVSIIKGKPLKEVLPQIANLTDALQYNIILRSDLLTFGSFTFLYERIPIISEGQMLGAMAIIKDTKKVLEEDSRIRNKLYNKGLYAKYHFNDIIGESETILQTKEIARSFARTESTIMINGESGTGKELFAQAIHNASNRKNGPFVAINCAALAENILESELFGYVEGAFTGARKCGKAGVFEMAKGGTIFLDEIAEIPLNLQSKLLRVLQERCIMRLGDDKIIPIDARVVAATHHNLIQDVRNENFREDLFFRLNVLNFCVPPLKSRNSDVLLLAKYFLQKNKINPNLIINYEISNLLLKYNWPGNIRELENMMERIAAIGTPHNTVSLINQHIASLSSLKEHNQLTREDVLQALETTNGNKNEAANLLNVHRSTLWRILNK